jgi:hypothetical protein
MDIRIALVLAAEFAIIPVAAVVMSMAGLAFNEWARGHGPAEPKDVPRSEAAVPTC